MNTIGKIAWNQANTMQACTVVKVLEHDVIAAKRQNLGERKIKPDILLLLTGSTNNAAIC